MKESGFEQAARFWDRKDADSEKMDPAKLREETDKFLLSHKVCALATGTGDMIRCTPLEYTWHDGALWIFSEGGRKFAGIAANSHAALAVFDTNTEFGKLHSLQMTGTVSVIDDTEDSAYVAEAAFRKIPIKMLQGMPEPMYLIRFAPEKAVFLNSDFKAQGFGSRQKLVF